MTPKENLMQVLSNGTPAWMPVCVHILNENNLPGFLPQELLARPLDRLRISEFVGGDILYETSGVQTSLAEGVGVRGEDDGDAHLLTLTTAEGRLTERVIFSRVPSPPYDDMPPGHALPEPVVTSAHAKHMVSSPADYKILRAYFAAQTFEADHKHVDRELGRVGDRGALILGDGPSSPLYSLVESYSGIERLTYDLCDAPAEVESAMDAMREAGCRWYEAAATTHCDAIRCTEDLDTKLISPALFRRYAAPALKEYAKICHAHGKLFVVHMCGHVRELLADIRDTGADAIHCLTRPPTGNTTLQEARRTLEGRTAAMIRIDPTLLLRGSGEQLDTHVAETCEGVGDWHNVLLIIPCGRASLWSIKRVIEQVHRQARWAARPGRR